VRRLFAGSNSAKGFHSFFHHIIGEDARRVYLLKGGPGTGKSRLMKDLAERLAAEGLSVELFSAAPMPIRWTPLPAGNWGWR